MTGIARIVISIASVAAVTFCVAGCGPTSAEVVSPEALAPSATPVNVDKDVPPEPVDREVPPVGSDVIDYSSWEAVTKEPVRMAPELFAMCAPPTTPKQEALGPHLAPAIRVYVNPIAAGHLHADRPGALPVGAAIVKEKLAAKSPGDAQSPYAYGAMIKRESGYDPEHGDWEYVFTRFGDEENEAQTERGKLANCIDCHSKAVAGDYLFRTYLNSATLKNLRNDPSVQNPPNVGQP